MVNKVGLALALVAAVGITAAVVKTSQVQLPKPLTESDISMSVNLPVLNDNYNAMNHLLITGQIDRATYDRLYSAYVTRFYQLVGG